MSEHNQGPQAARNEQPQTVSVGVAAQPYDPLHATSFTVFTEQHAITLAFRKTLYVPTDPQNYAILLAPVATIALSPINAKDLMKVLGDVLAAYEREFGAIADPKGAPSA
jgi:hypothetical protein